MGTSRQQQRDISYCVETTSSLLPHTAAIAKRKRSEGAMGNGKSRASGSDDELDPAALTQRTEALTQKLAEFDEMIAAHPPTSEDESEEQSDYVSVIIGDSSMAEVPGMVQKIDEIASQSKSLGEYEVRRRLEMGDDGLRANRVLHLAFTKEKNELVGCMSSTFQPPWTEQGCGHWGLLAVDPAHQGKGVASALVKAGEARLETVCDEIQMEYRHTMGNPDSTKLHAWYEGRLGFVCPHGPPGGPEGSQEFRMCRKRIPEATQKAGERRRLVEFRGWLLEQLEDCEREKCKLEKSAQDADGEPATNDPEAADEAMCEAAEGSSSEQLASI